MELFKAHHQWRNRPADERFFTLSEMAAACAEYRASAREKTVSLSDVRVEASDGEVAIVGKAGVPARLTNWAFGQLAARAGAPAGYLRELPATLAAQNLNHGLARESRSDASANLLFHKNGDFVLRSATSDTYARIWNADILASLVDAIPEGWQAPPARPAPGYTGPTRAATEADCLAISRRNSTLAIRPGDTIAPAGLYASDHDMFVFLVNEGNGINDGTGHSLGRGFFLWNSEVGAASFGMTTFLYDAVCGNHIVWSAKDVREVRMRHVGATLDSRAFRALGHQLRSAASESSRDLEARIRVARTTLLGQTLDEVTATVTKRTDVSRRTVELAYDAAEKADRYGDPRSAWGIVNGLTEVSQRTQYADQRVKADRAAGKILEAIF